MIVREAPFWGQFWFSATKTGSRVGLQALHGTATDDLGGHSLDLRHRSLRM